MSTPPYVPSILIDQVIDALGEFLQPFIAGVLIVRGQVNRVPPPVTPFVKLTELLINDLETPSVTRDPANTQISMIGPARIDVQVDFYGPSAGDWCKAVKGVFRSVYAPAQFPDGIKPLYCTDGTQAPLITGEEQFETHWIITASLQYNPTVIVPQQSATALSINILEDLP